MREMLYFHRIRKLSRKYQVDENLCQYPIQYTGSSTPSTLRSIRSGMTFSPAGRDRTLALWRTTRYIVRQRNGERVSGIMGNIRHKSKTTPSKRTARCSLRLRETDLQWVKDEAQQRGWSANRLIEVLIMAAQQPSMPWPDYANAHTIKERT